MTNHDWYRTPIPTIEDRSIDFSRLGLEFYLDPDISKLYNNKIEYKIPNFFWFDSSNGKPKGFKHIYEISWFFNRFVPDTNYKDKTNGSGGHIDF